jgi:hypothetical protein
MYVSRDKTKKEEIAELGLGEGVNKNCGHLFTYAGYADRDWDCMICDRINVWEYVHGEYIESGYYGNNKDKIIRR